MTDPVKPPDPDRRRFFRQFAGDVASSVGSMLGAAQLLQAESADAARDLLGTDGIPGPTVKAPTPAAAPDTLVPRDAATGGWRAPFRWDGDVCRVVDQQKLPDVLVDRELRGVADAVTALNEGSIVGAPVQAQVAAVSLAIAAGRIIDARPFARRATLRGGGNAFKLARSGSAQVAAAVDRMLAILEVLTIDATGELIAETMAAEAALIIGETTDAHGALVGNLLGALPGDASPLRVLALGSTGAMGGGQFGTALSAVQTAHHAGREVHALIAEGRPGLEGARIAAWELTQAGVPFAVVTDAAAPGHVAAGDVDAVLVAADRVAADGAVIAPAGAYGVALAAHEAGVPFLVCATTTAFDPGVATGAEAALEEGRPGPVMRIAGARIVPDGSAVRNRTQDLVPARLVTAIVTEREVVRAPDAAGLEPVLARVPAALRPSTPIAPAPAPEAPSEPAADTPSEPTADAPTAPDAVA